MSSLRPIIHDIVRAISPCDEIEEYHRRDVLEWISSGAQLFRLQSPDIPPRHLVSYIVLIDLASESCLLVHHRKAGKWLPAGGHVEVEEHPVETVKREIIEELGVEARFLPITGDAPLMVTSTVTVGSTAGHTDVSLWYLLQGSCEAQITFDAEEFHGVAWFTFDDLLGRDISTLDPHMHRFIRKLRAMIRGRG